MKDLNLRRRGFMVRFPSRRTGSQSSAENAPHNRTQLSSISLHPPERALLTQSRWLRFQLSASKKCHWLASHGSTDRVALPSALVASQSSGHGLPLHQPSYYSATPQTTSELMVNRQAMMGRCQAEHGTVYAFPCRFPATRSILAEDHAQACDSA